MVKERSSNQKISQISQGKFTAILSDWVVNPLTNDFGLDYDVRICSNFSKKKKQDVTSTSFYVQLKSTSDPCVPEPFHDLDVDDINLFVNQGIPVVLIKYYEKCDQFHWVIIQPYVWDVLDREDPDWSNKSNKRIRLPNRLDDLNELESQVLEAQKRIARHQVAELKFGEGLDSAELEKFKERTSKELKVVTLNLASKRTKSGEFEGAKKLLEEVASSSEDDSYKLNAILNLIFQCDPSNFETHPRLLDLTRQGIELADKISMPNYLHLLKIVRHRLQLVRLTSQLSRILYAKKCDERDGEGTFALFYQINAEALDSIYKSVLTSMSQSISELIKGKYKSELLIALAVMVESVTYQIQTLGFIDPEIMQSAEKDRAPFIQLFINALANETDKDYLQTGYFDLFLYYYWSGNCDLAKEYLKKAQQIALENGFTGFAEKADDLTKMIEEHPNPLIPPERKESLEDLPISEGKTAVRKHLEVMGIDFKNPDELTRDAIIPALDDLDPTEYLRYCEHFRISYVSTSPLGQSIALPSLGMKAIWCQYGTGAIGHSLTNMIPRFRITKCEGCKKRIERPDNWTCTYKEFEILNADPEFQKFIDHMIRAINKL